LERTELYLYLQENQMLIESLSNSGRGICKRITKLKSQHLEHPADQGVLSSLVSAVSEFRAEMRQQERRAGK
jgi:hypothetical protein